MRIKDISPQATAVCLDGSGGTAGKTTTKTSTNTGRSTASASGGVKQAVGGICQSSSSKTSGGSSTYNRAFLVVDYGNAGLPVVGHAKIYFQNTEGDLYMTEFTTECEDGDSLLTKKNNAQLYFHEKLDASEQYEKDMDNYNRSVVLYNKFIGKLKFGGTDYVEITGDFSECVEKAKMYKDAGYNPKYNLITNNCTDYVQDLLSVAKIDGLGTNFIVKKSEAITPNRYLLDIKNPYLGIIRCAICYYLTHIPII